METSDAEEPPAPARAPAARRGLNAAERDLLDVVAELQHRTGWCFAGQEYLGETIGKRARQVRRIQNSLQEKGYMALLRRKGKPTLCKVLDRAAGAVANGGQPGAKLARPRTKVSSLPRTLLSAPGRTKMSSYINTSDSSISAGQAGEDLFDQERKLFNPLRPQPKTLENGVRAFDNRPIQQRVANAFSDGRILFVSWRDESRLITRATWSNDRLILTIAIDGTPGETEEIVVPATSVGGLKLWR